MSIKIKIQAIRTVIATVIAYIKNIIDYSKQAIKGSDTKEKYRVLILLFSALFVFNYLAFCLHTNKNVFDIFPSIPPLEKKQHITLYLPDAKAATIIQEERMVPVFSKKDRLLSHLFSLVVRGAEKHENTSMLVPAPLYVRKIWLYGNQKEVCIFDVEPEILKQKAKIIKGSEAMFRKALKQTITKNIPSIKDVIILEKGIPNKALWEM